MLFKAVSICSSVFFLAVAIDCNLSTDIESSSFSQDVKDSCHSKGEPTTQNEFLLDEGILKNESDVESAYLKSNLSKLDNVNNNSSNANSSTVYVSCTLRKAYSGLPVEIVNASKLAMLLHVEPNITNRQVPGNCVVVLFYSPSCPFSCAAAPHFNALPRFFPDIKVVAIDAMKYRSINAQFGIVGTPTIMLFHNGRPAAKFNETYEYRLALFSYFIIKHTGIQPDGAIGLAMADLNGPVSSTLVRETDYYLLLSWLVIAARILYSFYYSTWGRSLVDATLNAWREAEAQHHHAD